MGYGVFEELEKLRKQQEAARSKYGNTTKRTVTPVPEDTDYGVFNELRKLQEVNQLREERRTALSTNLVSKKKDDEDDIAPVREKNKEEEEERTWFQKGAFDDGFSLKNTAKAIIGSAEDVIENLGTGIVGMGEKLVDSFVHLAPYYSQSQFYQNGGSFLSEDMQKKQNEAFEVGKKSAAEFIQKDLYDEEKLVKQVYSNNTISKRLLNADPDDISVFGEKTDALAQSAGQLAATAGLQAVGVPWFLTTGVTSYGGEVENALKQGATMEEAGVSGLITAGAEILTEKISGGIKFGGKTLDEGLTKIIARNISNKTVRTLTKLGLDAAGEGFEEVLSGAISAVGQRIAYDDNKDISVDELFFSEEAFESFIGGAVLGGSFSTINAIKSKAKGVDYVTELTANEQKVVDKEYKDRVAEAEKNGKVSQSEKAKIYDRVLQDMEKGYISTDSIEAALGGETYNNYRSTTASEKNILKEFEELGEKQNPTLSETHRYNELVEQVKEIKEKKAGEQLKGKLSDEVKNLVASDRLIESYNEIERRKQAFQADLSQYDEKQKATVKAAMESGVLNNSNRSHDMVDLAAKVSSDTGVPVRFSDTQKIKEAGLYPKHTVDLQADGTKTEFDLDIKNLDENFKPVVKVGGTEVSNYKVDFKNGKITFDSAPTGDVSVTVEGTETVNAVYTKDGIILNVKSPKYLETLTGHEITHAFEKMNNYENLKKVLKSISEEKGDWESRLKDKQAKYKGIENADAEREVIADLVGEYIFEGSDYIMELSAKDRNVFEKFIDGIKHMLKMVTAGSQEARRLEQAKREFEKVYRELAQKNTADGGVNYDIAALDNGNVYVTASRKVIEGKTKAEQRKEISNFFSALLEGKPSLDIQTIEGDVLTITKKETAAKARDDYKTVNGQQIPMTDAEFAVKMHVESHIDEVAEVSKPTNSAQDNKNHPFAKDGFTYRRAYFEDFDGQYYEVTLSIGNNGTVATVYNVGKIKGSVPPSAKLIAVVGSKPLGGTLSKVDIPQNGDDVKDQFSVSDEVTEEQNQRGLEAKSEVQYSLSHDTDYMDKAISMNNSTLNVTSDDMLNVKAMRERIATRMTDIKDRGLVGLPEDIEGNTYIANSSYDGTEENTTICPRSLASEAFTDAVSEYLGRPLTVEEQIYISQDLQGRSLTPECTYCYVATDRKAYRAFLGEYINQRDAVLEKVKANPSADVSRNGDLYKEFLNGRKDTKPMYNRFKMWVDAYTNGKPMVEASNLANISKLMGDINSEFGEELKPQIVDAMKYAQSASWAKKRVNYVAYNGHILKWKQDRINKLNSHYGLRMYSFSDFHPAFVLENMQMITDASVRGLKMLGYTKDTDFVEIFAPSGMNINVSTFGFETNGNVYENNIIGAEWEKAKSLREQYPNVGITFVATNDHLVNWAMDQDWIDVVIPYHLVRTGAEVAKAFGYTNYTSESSDAKDAGWKKGKDKNYIAPTDHNNDKATYLAALQKNRLKPRFERFIDNPNYMKLVNESRQPASESKPVQPVFNEDAAMVALAKLEANGYYQPIGGSVERMYEIAAEVAEDMTKQLAPVAQYSLSDEGDYGYHAGDLGKAEGYWNMVSSNRGTGHFGTGTYFVGNEAEINDSSYGSRPHEKVDFSKYRLFKPLYEDEGFQLHSSLKYINDNISKFPVASLDFDGRWDARKKADDAEYTLYYDDDASEAEKAEARKTIEELKVQFEAVGYDPENGGADELYENLNDLAEDYRAVRSRLDMIFARDMRNLGYDERSAKIDSIMKGIYDEVSQIEDAYDARYEDSPSTRFMKAMGYEGIDVRGFKGLDNTRYGSIIYDLKGEDLDRKNNIGTAKFSLRDTSEQPKQSGYRATLGKDVALETDEIAPVVENAALVAENDTIAAESSVEDLFPDDTAPIQEEYEHLLAEREDIKGAMDAYAAVGNYDGAEQLMAEYEAVQARIAEIEADDTDRLASLDEADAPPEMDNVPEDVADNVPLTKVLVNNLAKQVKSQLGLGNNRTAEVRELIERYSNEEFPSKAHLYTEIQERFGKYTEATVDEDLKGIKALLRTYGINVDESIKAEIPDYAQFMRSNFGKVRFSKEGLPVDVAYKEFQEALPGYFPESTYVPTDQLMRIIEVANMDTTMETEYEIDWQTLEDVTDTIMNGVAEFKQNRKETLANKHGRESFQSLMEDADQYVPPLPENVAPASFSIAEDAAPVRPAIQSVQAEPDDIAPVFETSSGQQSILPEVEVPKKITRKELHQNIMDDIKTTFREGGLEFDDVLKNAKDLPTFSTVDNTPQRVMEKALGYKEGQALSELTVNKVAQNETEGIKWLNSFLDKKSGLLVKISKQYGIKPGSKASAAAQMYAEGFYVGENDAIIAYGDRELAIDFPDKKVQDNIKKLARDPRIRQIYDETLAAINKSRARNAYPEIPRLDNYFLHFRAMEDTFSRIGLPFNPNDIRAKDLPTDLNGVTADLKPGQPYFASAMHRTGKRTSFDLLGGLEKYLTSAKNQIYHIDDIQTLRALRNYVAETYGQATGLQDLDLLSDEEAEQRIHDVYNSHLSTFAKFLNEEANVLAGKTSLIDRGLEGVIGRRGITFLDTLNRQVGANMVGFNVSSSLTNFLAPVQAFAKTNKFDFVKAMAQTLYNKMAKRVGKGDNFTEESPVMIRRKGAERFYRTPYQKVGDAGYVLMGVVDDLSTELIARTKYNEFTRKGMDSQKAHYETDKWVSRLMGDRSLGQQPQLYNSKMLGLFTKFQLEVRNQLDSQFYDTIQEAKVSTEEIENKLLRNAKKAAKITSTFAQLAVVQHLFGKAFESVAGYNPAFDIIEALIKTFGWDDEEEDEDTVLDNIEEGFLSLLGDLPYTSTLTGGRIPIASALPVTEFIKGEDQYGNEKNRWQTLGEAAPYYLLPGGYGQIKKTKAGMEMFNEDLPIAGSYTDSGGLRFPVEDTTGNRVQAALFGQWASENARDYFDNERKPLKDKQIQEFIDSDMPIRDYWNYREGLAEHEKLADKADYIDSLDLPISTKNMLVNNVAGRKEPIDMADYGRYGSLEEMDFATKNPEKYMVALNIGGYARYMGYQAGMKDMKLAEKADYISRLNLTTAQKNILINSETDRKEPIDLTGYENFSNFEEFEFAKKNPEAYAMAKTVGGYEAYTEYSSALGDIKADKDKFGNSISGSRKTKVVAYINSLNIPVTQKYILLKSQYPSTDDYNYEIIDYVNSMDDMTFEEKIEVLRKLDFDVDAAGNIYW